MDALGPGYGRWVSTLITGLENVNYLGAGKFQDIEKKGNNDVRRYSRRG